MDRGSTRWPLMTAMAVLALAMAGCSSLGGVVEAAMGKPAPSNAQAAPDQGAGNGGSAQAAPSRSASSGSPAVAYQYQFNSFYGGMWSMGWFGYGESNYKQGQGTVWNFAGTARPGEQLSLERALLKVNGDKSQWWRFRLDTGKDKVLFEFLVGADGTVQKVRYQDPDTKTVGEFVPAQGQQQGQSPSGMPRTRAEMASYLVGKQDIQVKGGSFTADHYLYQDPKASGKSEIWVSDKAPGYMVKMVFTSAKDGKTSSGELVQVESNVGTSLSSY